MTLSDHILFGSKELSISFVQAIVVVLSKTEY